MKKIEVRIVSLMPIGGCGRDRFGARAIFRGCLHDIGSNDYSTPWSAKRGAARFLHAIGATNWYFEGEEDAVAEAPAPSVKGVNSWARWEATDRDGNGWEYENTPTAREDANASVWSPAGGRLCCVRKSDTRPDWRTTLRRVNV